MKLDPHLPQLPSIGELLEHPRVKGVVERINRSTLAHRAAGFLEELRGSLAAKVGGGEVPSLTNLAERLARRLLGEPTTSVSVINATGLVLGDPALAPPLAERSLHAMFQTAGEFHRCGPTSRQSLEREICEVVGGEAAHVTTSFNAALTLAVAATAGSRELVVCGGNVDSANVPVDWRRLAARSGAVVRAAETGTVAQSLSAGNMNSTAAIVRAPDAEAHVKLADLAAVARERLACLIDVAPAAGTIDPAAHGFQSVATVGQRLAEGADLVVIDAAGLLGGPTCGVIVGRRRFVKLIDEHPLASLAVVDPVIAAALAATLAAYRDDVSAPVIYQLPVWQLLSAPLANLQQRAERLAPLMAEGEGIGAAEARQVESPWRRWGAHEWPAPSWAVALTPNGKDCATLRTQLERGPYPILAREAAGAVLVDLRAAFPRWDQQLVAAVVAAAR